MSSYLPSNNGSRIGKFLALVLDEAVECELRVLGLGGETSVGRGHDVVEETLHRAGARDEAEREDETMNEMHVQLAWDINNARIKKIVAEKAEKQVDQPGVCWFDSNGRKKKVVPRGTGCAAVFFGFLGCHRAANEASDWFVMDLRGTSSFLQIVNSTPAKGILD